MGLLPEVLDDMAGKLGPKWWGGVLLPGVLAALGVSAIVTQSVEIAGRRPLSLHGPTAIALGLALLACSLALHCISYWRRYPYFVVSLALGTSSLVIIVAVVVMVYGTLAWS